jgi:TPR repeat protein
MRLLAWWGLLFLISCAPPPEEPKTPADMQRACDESHFRSCVGLAYAYGTGKGVAKDPARAAALYERACRGELLVGCVNLGVLYAQGAGVPQDQATAKSLFERACERGPPVVAETGDASGAVACVDLGVMSQLGLAGPTDEDRALRLYHGACAAGFVPACTKEGLLAWSHDRERATVLLDQACAAGQARACRALEHARTGGEVERDEELLFAKVAYHY